MFEPQEIEVLRIKLSMVCGNYIAELTRKTNLSRSTVAKFFDKDKKIRPESEEIIYDASLEIIMGKEAKNRERAQLSLALGLSTPKPQNRPGG